MSKIFDGAAKIVFLLEVRLEISKSNKCHTSGLEDGVQSLIVSKDIT
jgi:hypothetical protein